ncbi:PPOX class F420-dependent oxidoreductase [Streptomyces xanthochromogenes]|uniref:PPOX class F420-dependent oxidoreductase n=1 Tax=Streptomyces TaxID=1883 RepID=UPI00136F35B7|nr:MULTISPECIES: PPOX class F420-dependent oxidoreductase [Streptomyces]MYV94919.1 PPOX class F420-dependent oxidoreductase [Streptomyces sp. SID1034]
MITTYGLDGAAVTDRPWVVRDGPALGILIATRSPLADRLRAGSRILVGEGTTALRGRAVFLDAEGSVRYRIAVVDKYGLPAALGLARSRLRHGLAGTVGVRLVLGAGAGGPVVGSAWRPNWSYSLN